ncbi:MAG: ABC transporter permease [Anaerolineae bacterium]|nr:ABC transporter permease [Anaerolineae bacterium]
MTRVLPKLNGEAHWGVAILAIIILLGVLVPLLSPFNPIRSAGDTFITPGMPHLFGTDQLGRDVFTRTFAAAQLDITLAVLGVAFPLVIGTFMGGVLGTTRNPVVSGAWLIIIDAINAFPFLAIVIGVVAMVGSGVQGLLIALAAVNWARYAKIARARALQLRDADFIHATQVLGYSRVQVLTRHILPNVYSESLAYGLSDFVIVIIAIAGLSFLGVGVRPPEAEWGAMISDGRPFLRQAWWITVFPGLTLSLTAIGVALLAQGLTNRSRGED